MARFMFGRSKWEEDAERGAISLNHEVTFWRVEPVLVLSALEMRSLKLMVEKATMSSELPMPVMGPLERKLANELLALFEQRKLIIRGACEDADAKEQS